MSGQPAMGPVYLEDNLLARAAQLALHQPEQPRGPQALEHLHYVPLLAARQVAEHVEGLDLDLRIRVANQVVQQLVRHFGHDGGFQLGVRQVNEVLKGPNGVQAQAVVHGADHVQDVIQRVLFQRSRLKRRKVQDHVAQGCAGSRANERVLLGVQQSDDRVDHVDVDQVCPQVFYRPRQAAKALAGS